MVLKYFMFEKSLQLKLSPAAALNFINQVVFGNIRTIVTFLAKQSIHCLIPYQSFLLVTFWTLHVLCMDESKLQFEVSTGK